MKRAKTKTKKFVPAALVTHKVEVKTVDVNNAASEPNVTLINSTGAFALLNGTMSGTGINNRVGRKIRLKSLQFNGIYNTNKDAGTVAPEYHRILLVYDRQPNSALPAVADIIQSIDLNGNTSSTVYDYLNPSNYERFKVLRDWKNMVTLNNTGAINPAGSTVLDCGNSQSVFNIKAFIKLNDFETHYNAGNAGTIADITAGSVLLLCLGNVVSANAPWQLQWSSRLRYLDL